MSAATETGQHWGAPRVHRLQYAPITHAPTGPYTQVRCNTLPRIEGVGAHSLEQQALPVGHAATPSDLALRQKGPLDSSS